MTSKDSYEQLRAEIRAEVLAELEATDLAAQVAALRKEIAAMRAEQAARPATIVIQQQPFIPVVPPAYKPWWYGERPFYGGISVGDSSIPGRNTWSVLTADSSGGTVRYGSSNDDPGAGSLAKIS